MTGVQTCALPICFPVTIAKAWVDREDDVANYFAAESKMPTLKVPKDGRRNLRPISLLKAIDFCKNNTNSGMPFVVRKGSVKAIYASEFNELLTRKDPCIMFTRTQEDGKTRTVWGYPFADTINEMMFYRPVLDYQRLLPYRSALQGPHRVNLRVTELIDYALSNGWKIVSIDMKSYDQSLKRTLQELSFEYIEHLYQPQYSSDIKAIFERFNTIGIITPDGVVSGPHGVPSGSTFTNEVDSIAQMIVLFNAGETQYDVQGDDAIVITRDPDRLFQKYEEAGFVINREKSYISDNFAVYLQNLYHTDYRDGDGIIGGIYPTYRALNRILYLERYIDFEQDEIPGRDYFSIRTICILENCKYHPLFKQLVKFVYNLDKYNLTYEGDSLTKYIQRMKL